MSSKYVLRLRTREGGKKEEQVLKATWVATITVLLASTASGAVSARAQAQAPAFDHIFVLLEENHDYSEIIGNPLAPYINSLASQNGVATQYSAVTHPSLPNYLALTGGSTFGITSDCTPAVCPVSAPNVADSIEGAGKTWKAYMVPPATTPTARCGMRLMPEQPAA